MVPVQVTEPGFGAFLVREISFWSLDADLSDAGQHVNAWFLEAQASCVSGRRTSVLLRFEASSLEVN